MLTNHSPIILGCLQGNLDMKYLTDRFERGKTAVQDFLKESHRFVKVDQMSDAHADLLQYQSQMNAGNGSLELQLLTMRTNGQ